LIMAMIQTLLSQELVKSFNIKNNHFSLYEKTTPTLIVNT